MPRYTIPVPAPPKPPPTKRRRRPQWHFKWHLLLVPAVIGLLLWMAQGLRPAFTWDDVMSALHVRNQSRYTELAVLGALITAAVAIMRVLRGPR